LARIKFTNPTKPD